MQRKSLISLLIALVAVVSLVIAFTTTGNDDDPRGRMVERKPKEPNKQLMEQAATGPVFLGSDTVPPHSWIVDTTQFPDGNYSFYAVAYDAAGNQTTSDPVTVTIDNSIGWCNDNGVCETDEDCEVCPNDCFQTADSCCGNGFCEVNETCSNCEIDCGVCPFCGDGTCNSNEDRCNCATDCGPPPDSERLVPEGSNWTCSNTVDDDCDGDVDCDDTDCVEDPFCVIEPPICNDNDICDGEEDCTNCPGDCVILAGAVCGNTRCETLNGENCLTCLQDCNGKQGGKKKDRYCCGTDGDTPVSCADPRCNTNGRVCTDIFTVNTCCGDGSCDGNEGHCDCEKDCGPRDLQELVGITCRDGVDNDCDNAIDCGDSDCITDSHCQQTCDNNGICQRGETCHNCNDCKGVLRGKPDRRHCCGNGQLEPAEVNGICDGNP